MFIYRTRQIWGCYVLSDPPQEPPSPGLPPAEAAFNKTVSAALESVTRASENMSTAAELPTLGGDRVRKEGEGRLLGFLLYL